MGTIKPEVTTIDGVISAAGLRVAIVASRFNAFIVDRLVEGAIDALTRTGAPAQSITVVRCPGAFELPVLARRTALSGRFDAVVCLGAVIRGSTPHFDYVAGECAKGIGQVGEAVSFQADPADWHLFTADGDAARRLHPGNLHPARRPAAERAA